MDVCGHECSLAGSNACRCSATAIPGAWLMVSNPSSGWVTLRAFSRLRGRHLRPSIRYSCVVGLVAHRRCTLCGPPAAQSILVRVAACCVDAHYSSLYTFIRFTTVPVAKVGVSTRVLDTHTRHIRHKPHSRFPGCAELPLHLTPCCDAGEVCTPGRQARGEVIHPPSRTPCR